MRDIRHAELLEVRALLAAIYDADFSTVGDGFADHTTTSAPAAGPASVGPFGAAGGMWSLSYDTTPLTDSTPNEFSVEASTQDQGPGVLQSEDWGGQGIFESAAIDVSSLSSVAVTGVGLPEDDFLNSGSEEFAWFYTLDGTRTDSTMFTNDADGMGGTWSTPQEPEDPRIDWSIPSLNVAGISTLTVGFEFNINGAGDGFEIVSVEVDDLGGVGAPGVTVTQSSGSTDVSEAGTTSDTFDVVLNAAPSANVTITLATPDGETTVSPTSLTFTPGNFGTPQTVTVTAVDDGDEEGGHTGAVTLAATSTDTAYDGLAVPDVTVNIADNDLTVDLVITGVLDGPLAGEPKVVELYALNTIDDLSVYGLGSVNTPGVTGNSEVTLSGSVNAGNYIYVSTTSTEFDTFFGTAPTAYGPVIVDADATAVNGDDSIELFKDTNGNGFDAGDLVDVFGDTSISGDGETWDYADGWAYRNDLVAPSTTFNVADWTFSGVDALDAETSNATATTPFPIGTYNESTAKEVFILSGIDGTSTSEAGATGDFGVVLNAAPTSDVTVTLATDGETTVSPTSITFTPANFATPQTVTVSAVNDSAVEGGHTSDVSFTVTSSDGGYNGATVASESIDITDNDATFAINELRISHSTLDNVSNNFVEIFETSGASVSTAGLHVLVISDEFNPGSVDFAFDLTTGMTDSQGFMLIADDGTTASLDAGDLTFSNADFFGSPATFLIVTGFTGSVGQDLDTNNDGTLEVTPWTSILDAVSLNDGDGTPDVDYADLLFGGPVVFNPSDNGFAVAAISASPDGSGTFEASVLPPSDPFTDTTRDTPGFTNVPQITVTENGASPGFTGVVEGGLTDSIEVVLNSAPSADVTITLSNTDGETTLSTSSLTFTPANFATPQSVTVTAVDDGDVEGSPHAGLIEISVSSTDPSFDGAFVPNIDVSIADNDSPTTGTPVLNELRVSHITFDNTSNNFVEVYTGTASDSVGDLTILAISENFAPGVIDFAFNLTGGTTDANGFFLLHESGFNSSRYTVDAGDLGSGLDYFGSATTFLLVEGFHGEQGFDLDSNNDGFLESTPWTSVLDAVTFDDADATAIGYESTVIVTPPELPFVPSGLRRRVDGGMSGANDGWDILQFNDDGPDTPGYTNVLAPMPTAGNNFFGVRIIDPDVSPGDASPGGGDTIEDAGTQASLLVSESGVTDTFEVVLDSEPTSTVTVTLSSPDGDTSFSPSVISFTSGNWFVPRTVTVSAVDDGTTEGDHTGVINLTVASTDSDYGSLTPPSLEAQIIDNDAPGNAVVINEIHNDPFGSTATDLFGDANGDGVRDAADDEFIELVNTSGAAVDISGWTISDEAGVKHTFDPGTSLAAGAAIVVFGGGTPVTPPAGATFIVSSTGALGFGRDDSAFLRDASSTTIDFHTWQVDDQIDDGVDNSLARIPDFTGSFVDQGSEDGFVTLFTPGLSNVLPFDPFTLGPGITVTRTGNQAVTEGATDGTESDSFEVALNAAPTADVTITLAAADGETSLSTTSLTFTPANFATPQSVTVTAVDDSDVEGGHAGTITLVPSSSDTAYSSLAIPDVVVAVTDNDANFQINEIRVSHTSLDNTSNNFFELYETSGASVPTDGLSLVVIRSETFNSESPGEIEQVFSLDGGVTDLAGFFLLHDDGFAGTPDAGDLSNNGLDFIGAPMTYVVVSGFTGVVGQDLDDGSVGLADDGTFDVTPWDTVIDSITLDDLDGDTDLTIDYSSTLGGTKVDGLGDGFVLAAASAIPDGSNTFSASAVDPFNDDSGDTPGATNVISTGGTVAGRFLFYNQSNFDGDSALANAADDGAIDTTKSALLGGNTATFANYTGHTGGINGIMIDIMNLPTTPVPADFEFTIGTTNTPGSWASLGTSPGITVRDGAGTGGSDRVTLIWPDDTIVDTWLEVTVLSSGPGSIVSTNDVFYFGSKAGEVGAGSSRIDSADFGGASSNFTSLFGSETVDSRFDVNKSGRVDSADTGFISANFDGLFDPTFPLISPPASEALEAGAPPSFGFANSESEADGLVSNFPAITPAPALETIEPVAPGFAEGGAEADGQFVADFLLLSPPASETLEAEADPAIGFAVPQTSDVDAFFMVFGDEDDEDAFASL